MNARTPGLIATLCVAGFVTWLAVGEDIGKRGGEGRPGRPAPPDGQVRTDLAVDVAGQGGRPCDGVLSWTLADVDPRFGLDRAEARSAVEEAASLWEQAVGRPLFQADLTSGLPIRFVYDARQARANERVRLERAFEDRDALLEARRAALERDRSVHLEAGARYEERARRFEQALERHNERVRAWNDAGARPGETAESLREAEEELAGMQGELETELKELRDGESRLRTEGAGLAAALDERNREADRLERDFPLTRVEAGAYREVVRQDAGGRVDVGPEIRVFVFVTRDDLVGLLAHELGHALGLEHAREVDAVMSAEHDRASRIRQRATVTPTDVALWRERCP